ncbi:MAG TPA: WXG100 family type VII secretion target [Herpetosiphonaceae bacterium]
MAAPIVEAQYDALEELAGRFGRQSEQAGELQQRVRAALGPLERGGWQGDAAVAFFNEMSADLFPALARLQEAMDDARGVTLQVSGIIAVAEEEAASLFSGGLESLTKAKEGGLFDRLGDAVRGAVDRVIKALQQAKDTRDKQNAEISKAISEGKHDEAIALASKYYNIDTSAAKSIVYNAGTAGEGATSKDTSIKLGNDAFASPGWLASTIEHELRHAEQAKDRWYTGPEGTAINEVEAYDLEIQNAAKNGLTEAQVNDLKSRRKSYYDQLSADNQKRVDGGDYTLPPGQTNT